MKAIQYLSYGSYEENRLVDLERPKPAAGQVLVAVRAAGINPLDNTFRSGHIFLSTPENLPRIGGQSGVGTVVESTSPKFNRGDRVLITGQGLGLVADGTWREFAVVPADALIPAPPQLDDAHAAAFLAGGGYLTGYLALTELAHFKEGESVLAPAIGSAVGMETVQIARRLGASKVISTASTSEKVELARNEGYQDVIDLSKESLKDGVLRLTGGKGVDVVVDGVSGTLTSQALGSLAFGGRLVIAGYAGGREVEVNVTDIIWKASSVHGFSFRAFTPEVLRGAVGRIFGFLAEGALQPKVGKIFPLEQAAEAVRYLIEGRPYGRVILEVSSDAEGRSGNTP